jgi:hypothetical protein
MVANSVFLTQETQESGDADFSGTLSRKKQEDIEKPSNPQMQMPLARRSESKQVVYRTGLGIYRIYHPKVQKRT